VNAPETIEACDEGKAPKGDSIHACFLQFLATNSKENSESFVHSLRRPLGEFMDFLQAERITTFAQLDTKTLLAYRKAAKRTQGGEERALSTMRMSLARVVTFLRAQEEGTINADISVLRVKLTAEEKAEAAEAAADAAADEE
jgi:site-specific recombinase XerD